MQIDNKHLPLVAAGAIVMSGLAYLAMKPKAPDSYVVLLGDVGGTNIRLTLRRLCIKTRTSTEIKPFQKFKSQELASFESAVDLYLKEFKGTQDWPVHGVVGIAGEVENNTVRTTNCPDWPIADGAAIAENQRMQSFTFINDFAANGYGLCQIGEHDVQKVNQEVPKKDGVKVVMGPGTGLGEGYLCKSMFSKYYEVYSSEGGHTDFSVTSEEDWELRKFAVDYIRDSKNVENLRSAGEITRVSIERLCAGPAVPLIYEFLKARNPDLPRPLEKEKSPDQLESKDIIEAGMAKDADPLCFKVVEKLTEIFAVEVGNMALKTLPFGGIYLVGGVTTGIMGNLLTEGNHFQKKMQDKGRLERAVSRCPVFIVKPHVELGILGTEECAFRQIETAESR